MSDLDALLAGIVADPSNAVRWLVMADWLEENGQPERAELVRVHRELLRTCTATRETKARKQLHARMMELMRSGVQPCLPTRTITLPGGVEMRFSFIPPGSFLMGSPKSEAWRKDDEHRHRVTLTTGFWLGQAPVTQQQWMSVMTDNPSHHEGDELPVNCVSWNDAEQYLRVVAELTRFVLRLPSEAEWEYAARAGTSTPYYWGSELDGTQANCDGAMPYKSRKRGPTRGGPSPVGCYERVSPHPWSLVDVVGNVTEWCGNSYQPYPEVDAVDPVGPFEAQSCVYRGGSHDDDARECRLAYRCVRVASHVPIRGGFRVAADLSALV